MYQYADSYYAQPLLLLFSLFVQALCKWRIAEEGVPMLILGKLAMHCGSCKCLLFLSFILLRKPAQSESPYHNSSKA